MIERPGSMTNIFYFYEAGKPGIANGLKPLHEAGFDVIDLNMCPMQRNACELCEDDNWEKFTDMIGNEAAKYGMTFTQSHPPYAKLPKRRKTVYDEGCEYNEFFLKMMKRALEIDARLGIPWAVMHPVSCRNSIDSFSIEEDAAYNYEYFAPLLDLCEKRGVGFAFENMCDVDGIRRFGTTPDELLAIVDRFEGRKVGICWDTGHGNRTYTDQIPALRRVADRLVCTHIDDNKGDKDLHQIPLMGTVNWDGILRVLRESGYQGAFIYELALFGNLPMELRVPLAQYAFRVAEHLLAR